VLWPKTKKPSIRKHFLKDNVPLVQVHFSGFHFFLNPFKTLSGRSVEISRMPLDEPRHKGKAKLLSTLLCE
jgi:hypothetical protein